MYLRIFQKRNQFLRECACAVLLISFFVIATSSGVVFLQDGSEILVENISDDTFSPGSKSATPFPIHFFYNTHCGSCQASIQYIDEFRSRNPDIVVKYHDLFNNTPGFALYEDYKHQFNRTALHYPVVFIGNIGIMGSDDIIAFTQPLTDRYQENMKVDLISSLFSWISQMLNRNQ